MGHFSVLIPLILLQSLITVCKLEGGENESSYEASIIDFGQCKDSIFWKNAFELKQANNHRIDSLSGLYCDINVSESDLKARIPQNKLDGETMRHCKLIIMNHIISLSLVTLQKETKHNAPDINLKYRPK